MPENTEFAKVIALRTNTDEPEAITYAEPTLGDAAKLFGRTLLSATKKAVKNAPANTRNVTSSVLGNAGNALLGAAIKVDQHEPGDTKEFFRNKYDDMLDAVKFPARYFNTLANNIAFCNCIKEICAELGYDQELTDGFMIKLANQENFHLLVDGFRDDVKIRTTHGDYTAQEIIEMLAKVYLKDQGVSFSE